MRFGPKTMSVLLVILSGALLMVTSQFVQNLEREKRALQKQIQEEEQKIRYLEAEWAYLNRPDRLERLVVGYGVFSAGEGSHVNARTNGAADVVLFGQAIPEPMIPVAPVKKPVTENIRLIQKSYDEPTQKNKSEPKRSFEDLMETFDAK